MTIKYLGDLFPKYLFRDCENRLLPNDIIVLSNYVEHYDVFGERHPAREDQCGCQAKLKANPYYI